MRMRWIRVGSLLAVVASVPGLASAQVTAAGRATGFTLDLLGSNLVTTSDTGPGSATAPGSFGVASDEETLTIPSLAIVSSGISTSVGTATVDGFGSFVDSNAGNATARVLPALLPGADDAAQVVSDGSQARLECTDEGLEVVATSRVDAITIAGTPIEIPGESEPNTTIVAPDLAIITLNEQNLFEDPPGTVNLEVSAAHIQLISTGEVIDVFASTATAQLGNLPEQCRLGAGGTGGTGGAGGTGGTGGTGGAGGGNIIPGDSLVTTGGGGCAAVPAAGGSLDGVLILAAAVGLAFLRRRNEV